MRKRFVKAIFVVFIILIILFFSTRNFFLSKIILKATKTAETTLGLQVKVSEYGFSGITKIYLTGLIVIDETNDTIIRADSIAFTPRILPLLVGKKRLNELMVANSKIKLTTQLLQFQKFNKNSAQADTIVKEPANYAGLLNSVQERFFVFIPAKICFKNLEVTYQQNNISSLLKFIEFSYAGNNFQGNIAVSENNKNRICDVTGSLNRSNHSLAATISQPNHEYINIPFIKPIWGAYAGFDSLNVSVNFVKKGKDQLSINGNIYFDNFAVQQKGIGPDTVVTQNGSFSYNINVGKRYFELDSTSQISFKRFSFSPYLRFEKDSSRRLTFAFLRKEFEACDLFESLPDALFTNFKGIETEGKLAYHLRAVIDFDHLDSIYFDSQLENKNFRIKKYGTTDFRMINGSFTHEIYENDFYVKSIVVGPENPDFVSITDISTYLKYAVLTSEDGDFFYHKGFNERAFRESIATNIKEKRFARGGSTISMQLVKNVFLNRKKTISRKIEEALIVWCIENLHLSSKERMFEVYLNIIELGPGVYGIKHAADFYFKKKPSALNLQESIFLTSIIPHPKSFRYSFVSNGVLRDFLASYYKLLGGIMVRRNQISSADTMNLIPHVKLTGEAQKLLLSADSIAPNDSIEMEELNLPIQ